MLLQHQRVGVGRVGHHQDLQARTPQNKVPMGKPQQENKCE